MNKYPTNKLTTVKLNNAKPKQKKYKLADGGGLYCDIMPTGNKVFRYNYRFAGKQKTYTIGSYPTISLESARKARIEAKEQIRAGIDPSQQKKIEKLLLESNSFGGAADLWLKDYISNLSESHQKRVKSLLKLYILPWFKDRELSTIKPTEIKAIIQSVAKNGTVYSAKRTKGIIQQVFDYGVANDLVDRNPANDLKLKLIIPKTVKRHYAAITEPKRLGDLLRAIDAYEGSMMVKIALKIAPMVLLRPSELVNGEWVEIDLKAKTWTIPAKRRKLATHLKKANLAEHQHVIPLCDQVIELLKELHQFTGLGKYLFPSPRGNSRPLSNNALRIALRGMGFEKDEMSVHGFRGVGSTFLNTMGYRSEVIEAQLSHKDKDQVREAYNHSSYFDERRLMMQEWGDYLEALKSSQGDNVIPIKRAG